MKQYDVNYFIKKFEAIPEHFWITGKFGTNGYHCAYGHCGASYKESTHESDAFSGILPNGASINDGHIPFYQQSSPKQRVLAALYDLKAEEAVKEANNIIKTSKVEEYAEV